MWGQILVPESIYSCWKALGKRSGWDILTYYNEEMKRLNDDEITGNHNRQVSRFNDCTDHSSDKQDQLENESLAVKMSVLVSVSLGCL